MIGCPFHRYYVCHAGVAVAIAACIGPFLGLYAGLSAGVFFYIGREFTQWEQGAGPGLPFDWKGLAAPFIACILIGAFSWL